MWQNFFSCGWVSSLDAGGDDGPPSLSEEANFPANSDYEGDHQFSGKTGTVRTRKMMKAKGHAKRKLCSRFPIILWIISCFFLCAFLAAILRGKCCNYNSSSAVARALRSTVLHVFRLLFLAGEMQSGPLSDFVKMGLAASTRIFLTVSRHANLHCAQKKKHISHYLTYEKHLPKKLSSVATIVSRKATLLSFSFKKRRQKIKEATPLRLPYTANVKKPRNKKQEIIKK